MTTLGFLMTWGMTTLLVAFITFCFGMVFGGTSEHNSYKPLLDHVQAKWESWMKECNWWIEKHKQLLKQYQDLQERYARDTGLQITSGIDFLTQGPNNVILEAKSDTVKFPDTMTLPIEVKPKKKKSNVTKKTSTERAARTVRRKRVSGRVRRSNYALGQYHSK